MKLSESRNIRPDLFALRFNGQHGIARLNDDLSEVLLIIIKQAV